MAAPDRDTITAIATPPGKGGVGIVRISGSNLGPVLDALLDRPPRPRYAEFRHFLGADGRAIDSGIALYFPAPRSFTGENVLELHGHGGPVVLDLLLRRTLQLGCRLARPGEFSERAYLNGKLDLAQAEAIADLIDSSTEESARSAQRSLQGEFSAHIHHLQECLVRLRTYVEAAIDFSDEDIDLLDDATLGHEITGLLDELDTIDTKAHQGALLREGLTTVIAGRPNVGKSSLLNALAGRDLAIVTEIPGTTRDLLRESLQVGGLPLHIVDTAGLRDSEDPIEREGIRRARDALANADCILLVCDARHAEAGDALPADLPETIPLIRIFNKIDLTGTPASLTVERETTVIHLSARTGDGVDLLRQEIIRRAGYKKGTEGVFSARRRHLDAIRRARAAVTNARLYLHTKTAELLAEELRAAQKALGEITGEFTNEDLLNRIFSSFCLGK
ncbi:tRNA uridine-5-carboxymethylaminomethyl(34) synthesis GTPase MnmE [Methylococcus capsulatus]|uniref:tRNA uridine-5-carboxymethylaminomethyl(34) synthesis GTPase MnmE n=1 Tax=Methylococcus capsulatus TaxID=414 RepID=UPI001C5296D1|nr:tRNA uridine-5-carboxymethylaminomethyl(34) synthesis GTPase MnmE [Methylococcus capsulatus]QXP86568.1 tRNA uridine-5-carboxymethylaminomethyl(34) synthesis GTPase MnmE [Methylococcus capsulatus]QXP93754.1 tRNA uridine-5-carboxymethylaminomethyl(34) synthesis GTPase MnmE [Methylococcus capsulatus]UQN11525.1 tRNA uridine-5-carboxymethylaminomethyl(34) synthesis GTPase MnmE [Methylococcus capsulatus]